jgi:hypothetical protein
MMAVWGRYIKFQGSDGDVTQLKTLMTQSVLFRRPNGISSMAMRLVIRGLIENGAGNSITIAFGLQNETRRVGSSDSSYITIERTNSIGHTISDGQMVVSIMHELLHATDNMTEMSLFDAADRHNEIYRIQNQTLYDLGLPLDPGPRGSQVRGENGQPNGDKYISLKW